MQISHFVDDFSPAISQNYIKVDFLPIKNNDKQIIKGIFVVKIIIKQGDPTKLYSLSAEKFQAYMRYDGESRILKVERITQEIIRRSQGQHQAIDPKLFDDPKPEQLEDIFSDNEKLKERVNLRKEQKGSVILVNLEVPKGKSWMEIMNTVNPNMMYKSLIKPISRVKLDDKKLSTGTAKIYFSSKQDADKFIETATKWPEPWKA